MANEVRMMRIGKTALLKGEDGNIRAGVVQGHSEELDMKRVSEFGIMVDLDALKDFIGVKKQKAPKKTPAKKDVDESTTKE